MYDMFLEGLPTNILYNILKPPTPTTYDALKERVRSLAQGKAIINEPLRQRDGGGFGSGYVTGQLAGGQENRRGEGMSVFDPQGW